jgi:hypothetical protein
MWSALQEELRKGALVVFSLSVVGIALAVALALA